eukprot:jgi/Bigna1/140980/aug1.59_g15688
MPLDTNQVLGLYINRLTASDQEVKQLKAALKGNLLTPTDDPEGYNEARVIGKKGTKTWNIDAMGYPSAIALCSTPNDVSECLKFYRKHCFSPGDKKQAIPLCIACGRHSHQSLKSDSFVIDLSLMRGVKVNPEEKYVDVPGGSLQRDIDEATAPYNLATTAGHVGSTGCGGLIIQGGHGFLERVFGLAIDNLLEVDVVTPDGNLITADEKTNSDLFWAIKGGGGNFGVVTRFRLRLHPIPPKIFAGQRVHMPLGGWFKNRSFLIQKFASVTVESKDNKAGGLLVLPCAGPVVEMLLYVDDPEVGKKYFAKHRKEIGWPISDNMKPRSYHNEIQKFAPDEKGNYYMTGILLPKMSPKLAETLDALVSGSFEYYANSSCVIMVAPMGGAVSDKNETDTANPHRDVGFWIIVIGSWKGQPRTDYYIQNRRKSVAWVRKVKELLTPFAKGHYAVLGEVGVHAEGGKEEESKGEVSKVEEENAKTEDDTKNLTDEDLDKYREAELEKGMCEMATGLSKRNVYGKNLAKLQRIKKQYDPENIFRMNDNIIPKA